MKNSREFSTKNADYTLNPSWINKTTNIDYIKQFDAIILETGVNTYEEISLKSLSRQKMYSDIIKENLKLDEPIPIFYVDTPYRRFFDNIIVNYVFIINLEALSLLIPASIPMISTLFNSNTPLASWLFAVPFCSGLFPILSGHNKKFDKISNYLSLSHFYTNSGYRSAVSAKKMDEFIAPEIQKRMNENLRPNIFIDFGAGHNDMLPYLKHKVIRDSVIKWNNKLNIHILNKEYMNIVCELRAKDLSSNHFTDDRIVSREYEPWSDEWENIVWSDKKVPKNILLNMYYDNKRPLDQQISKEWERIIYKI